MEKIINLIPYGKQHIDEDDIRAVVEVLKSDWLTTGPKVQEFETAIAGYVGSKYAVAVNSGTAALHCAMYVMDIGPGDEVILPPMTFAATANAILYQGGTPVFVDVEADTLLIDPEKVEEKITQKTKAIVAVDYAGQPCDYERLREIANRLNLILAADSCHALGAEYKGKKAGSIADLTVFSFHPVKHITTGEGGMVTTNNEIFAGRMRQFRNHGITSDFRTREKQATFLYEMTELGYNYRLPDIQCALGISQLKKLPMFLERRRAIARRYDAAFMGSSHIQPLANKPHTLNAYHLYVIRVLQPDRGKVFQWLREKGIGVNVHYLPVYRHPYYAQRPNPSFTPCPVTEEAYEQILSLPMYPSLTDEMANTVIREVLDACG